MRFILGPLIVVLGILMMKYTVRVTEFTGRVDFAEKYFSGGLGAGTYTWWRLVGLGISILGALWFFGLLNVLGELLANLFSIRQ